MVLRTVRLIDKYKKSLDSQNDIGEGYSKTSVEPMDTPPPSQIFVRAK